MTAEEQQVVKDGLKSIRLAQKEVLKQLGAAICRADYFEMRYHDIQEAFVSARLDIRGLEDMVGALQKRLGDKGLDIELGNDLDVV